MGTQKAFADTMKDEVYLFKFADKVYAKQIPENYGVETAIL